MDGYPAMWIDERINDEPEYAPPSRKTLLAIMRRKIGRGLQECCEVPLDLPPRLQELITQLDERAEASSQAQQRERD
jgi:hypothetical protein